MAKKPKQQTLFDAMSGYSRMHGTPSVFLVTPEQHSALSGQDAGVIPLQILEEGAPVPEDTPEGHVDMRESKHPLR